MVTFLGMMTILGMITILMTILILLIAILILLAILETTLVVLTICIGGPTKFFGGIHFGEWTFSPLQTLHPQKLKYLQN